MIRNEFCKSEAKRCLAELGITVPPVDVIKIAGQYGLAVDYVDKPDAFSGRLRQERRIIEVNKNHHIHRQRWTIAHEIGHFLLQHDSVFFVGDNDELGVPTRMNDKEADAFAANLLMPAEWLVKDWAAMKDIKTIARHYWVSDVAITYRLIALKKI
jgi:Zn-dependent peptidase ImmA (M78 family)